MVHWVLSRPNIFLNTTSDATLLPMILEAANQYETSTSAAKLEEHLKTEVSRLELEPIFIRGVMDTI